MRSDLRRLRREKFINLCKLNPTIVIDCEFHDYASEKESKSLANQIMQSYGAIRRSTKPFNLIVCGIEEKSYLDEALSRISGTERWTCLLSHESLENMFNVKELVYLSADSDTVLEDLSSDGIYVIGGIVDRNRLNGITYNKARTLGTDCKRLPIKENISMKGSHILSVNTCVNILLDFYENRDWEMALRKSIPKRKF